MNKEIEKTIERLAIDIDREESYGADEDLISWRYEEGVIISVKEARLFLDLLMKIQNE